MQRPSPRFRSEEYSVYEAEIRRNVLPKFIELCMETPYWYPSGWAPTSYYTLNIACG